MSDDPNQPILPTVPPPPPPPDLRAALDAIDKKRVMSLLPRDIHSMSYGDIVSAVIDAIREQLPPPAGR
jgi:hypothetical protein